MTDKIVQLVDKDNNNIYPVTTADAPTITVTSVDPGEGVSLAANHFIAVYGNDQDSYSTNEMETNAKWIDGKTIYKKTINFGALPDATTKSVAHGISNIGYIVKLEGITFNSTRWLPLSLASPATVSTNIMLSADSTNVTIITGIDRTSDSAYVTLYYTKSV